MSNEMENVKDDGQENMNNSNNTKFYGNHGMLLPFPPASISSFDFIPVFTNNFQPSFFQSPIRKYIKCSIIIIYYDCSIILCNNHILIQNKKLVFYFENEMES